MSKKFNFNINGHSECCWADVEDNHCTKCGAKIHHHLGIGGMSDPGLYIQAFKGLYNDADTKKVRIKVLGKCYKATRILNHYTKAKDVSRAEALAKCVAKYGPTGPRRYRSYHIECRTVLTFNAETGRTFYTNIYGKHKNVIDCSYGSNHLRDFLGKVTIEDIMEWAAAAVRERKKTLPRNAFQLDLAWEQFPVQRLVEEHREQQRNRNRMTRRIVSDLMGQTAPATGGGRPVHMALDLVDELRRLLIALHWPNLVNTNLPLTTKFFDYNRKLYDTLRTETSGSKLVKAIFKDGAKKPILNFLRETAAYGGISDLLGCFGGDAVMEIISWKGAKQCLSYNKESRRRMDPVPGTNPVRFKKTPSGRDFIEAIGPKRAFNQFKQLVYPNGQFESNGYHSALHFIMDGADMLSRLRANEGFENYTLHRSNSLQEAHDRVSAELNKIARANKVIPFSKEELENEMELDGYTFAHPRETHDLIGVGQKMNICVGGYDNRAYNKMCNILLVVKDRTLMVCIEYYGNHIHQAKANNNGMPTRELRDVIIKWAEKCELEWKTCYDLKPENTADAIQVPGNIYGGGNVFAAAPAAPVAPPVLPPVGEPFQFNPAAATEHQVDMSDLSTIVRDAIAEAVLPMPDFNGPGEQRIAYNTDLLPEGGYAALLELEYDEYLEYEERILRETILQRNRIRRARAAIPMALPIRETADLQRHPMAVHLGLDDPEELYAVDAWYGGNNGPLF